MMAHWDDGALGLWRIGRSDPGMRGGTDGRPDRPPPHAFGRHGHLGAAGMSAPHYILHIGPMKTASTYLQKCIFENLDALAAHGIHFPRALGQPDNMHVHHPLKLAMHDAAEYDAAKRALDAVNQAGHKTVFLTSELLPLLMKPKLRQLRDLIGSDSVTIVYMARRWSDRMRSFWYNRVQCGETLPLQDFAHALLTARRPGGEVDYARVWQDWADIFGRDALRIMPASNIVDEGGDLYDRFCRDIFGMDDPPPASKRGHRLNASGDARDAETIRALNALSQAHGVAPKRDMYKAYWPMRKSPALRPLHAAMAAHEEMVVLDDADPALDAVYEKLQGFADRLTSRHGGGTIFTRKRREVAAIGQGYLAQDDGAVLLRDVFDCLVAARGAAP